MASFRALIALAAGTVLATGACGGDRAVVDSAETPAPVELPAADGTLASAAGPFEASLAGAAVTPGPGDPDGTGTTTVTVESRRGEVCYRVEVAAVAEPTAVRLYRGAAGSPGEVVLNLEVPREGRSEGCVAADRSLLARLAGDPSTFFVMVHTAEWPGGALRGQLG